MISSPASSISASRSLFSAHISKLTIGLVGGATLLLLLISPAAVAQGPGSGGPVPAPVTPTDPTAVPLDGGASLLLAAGTGLALRQLRRRRA